MNELVSVVITTHDRDSVNTKYIERSLASVLNQTYKNIEVIIIIDSNNNEYIENIHTLKIKQKNKNIKIFSKSNMGGSKARNFGVTKSNGFYICLLDDDDEFLESKIEHQLFYLKGKIKEYNSNYIISSTKVYIENMATKPTRTLKDTDDISEFLFKRKFGRIQGLLQTSTFMTTKECLIKYPFTDYLIKHQDYDFVLKAYKFGVKIVQMNKPLSIYHQDVPKINRVGAQNNWQFSIEWYKNNNEFFKNSLFLKNIVIPDMITDQNLTKKELFHHVSLLNKKLGVKFFIFNLEDLILLIRILR